MPPGKSATIANRLSELADKHSQSELARKTGVNVANVHRYMKGRRIPAEFCASLVRQLGVNPAWLLTGDGAPLVADVTQGTQRMAGDVLELVQALNAVSQMRLGALAGKHHLRVLRELNDALQQYESLRARLNAQSTPIFKQLIDDLEKALGRMDVNRADELRAACDQVERLTDAPELTRRLNMQRGHLALLHRDNPGAIRYIQQQVRERISTGAPASREDCDIFRRCAIAQMDAGRVADGLRILEAFSALAGPQINDWPQGRELEFLRGTALADTGQLQKGLHLMQRHVGVHQGVRLMAVRCLLLRGLLYAGLVSIDEALGMAPDIQPKGMYLLEHAALTQPQFLGRLLAWYHEKVRVLPGDDISVIYPVSLQMTLRGQDGLGHFLARVTPEAKGALLGGATSGSAAALALAQGDKRAARKHYQAAVQDITSSDRRHQLRIYARVLLERNALVLGSAAEQTAAKTYFAALEAEGYVYGSKHPW